MLPAMNNSDQKPEAQNAVQRDWSELRDNVMSAAGRKSEALMTAPDVDDVAFERGARVLRALVGAAEIAHRMQRIDKLEKENDEREESTVEITKTEFDRAYQSAKSQVDREIERERAAKGGADRRQAGGDAAGDGSRKGVDPSCA